MFPGFATDGSRGGTCGYSILSRQLRQISLFLGIGTSHLSDSVGRELRSATTLLRHISAIVSGSAEEQMVRPHARGIVALVQCVKPIWDRAIVEFIGNAMGAQGFAARLDFSISLRLRTSPDPAAVRFLYLTPKAVRQRCPWLSFTCAGESAVFAVGLASGCSVVLEYLTAMLADALSHLGALAFIMASLVYVMARTTAKVMLAVLQLCYPSGRDFATLFAGNLHGRVSFSILELHGGLLYRFLVPRPRLFIPARGLC